MMNSVLGLDCFPNGYDMMFHKRMEYICLLRGILRSLGQRSDVNAAMTVYEGMCGMGAAEFEMEPVDVLFDEWMAMKSTAERKEQLLYDMRRRVQPRRSCVKAGALVDLGTGARVLSDFWKGSAIGTTTMGKIHGRVIRTIFGEERCLSDIAGLCTFAEDSAKGPAQLKMEIEDLHISLRALPPRAYEANKAYTSREKREILCEHLHSDVDLARDRNRLIEFLADAMEESGCDRSLAKAHFCSMVVYMQTYDQYDRPSKFAEHYGALLGSFKNGRKGPARWQHPGMNRGQRKDITNFCTDGTAN